VAERSCRYFLFQALVVVSSICPVYKTSWWSRTSPDESWELSEWVAGAGSAVITHAPILKFKCSQVKMNKLFTQSRAATAKKVSASPVVAAAIVRMLSTQYLIT
jgi:hypothetical protein